VSYAWYVDGRRISASGPRLRVLRKWAGDRIRVTVTYTRTGWTTTSRTTPSVRIRR
jgi:hypothetical protein